MEKVYLVPAAQLADPDQYSDVVTYAVSEAIATSDWVGAGRGGIRRVDCDVPAPGQAGETAVTRKVVTGMYLEAEGVDVVVVNSVTLLCEYFPPYQTNYGPGRDFRTKPEVETSQQTFEGPRYNEVHTGTFDSRAAEGSGRSVCGATISGSNATVAVGIHGRAGKWLDALGVICEDPKLLVAVRPVARAQLPLGTPLYPVLPICEAAQQARARNSAAAPGLEERCVNPEPVKRVDRVQPAIGGPSGIIYTICEAALKARERNSPAAPGLDKRCRESKAVKPAARLKLLDGANGLSTRDAGASASDSTTGSETVGGTSTQAAAKTSDATSAQAAAQTAVSERQNAQTAHEQVAKRGEAENQKSPQNATGAQLGAVAAAQVGNPIDHGVKPVGRVKLPDGATSKSALSKCEAAKVARARNSPAAPGLEAQCAAQLAEASSVASSTEAIASRSRETRKSDLQREVAEENQRLKAISAEVAEKQDASTLGKLGSFFGSDPQPSGVATAAQKQGAGGAARRAAPGFQPENTIAVRVRYRKDYGYRADTSALGRVGSASCAVFSISAAVSDGSTRQRNAIPISSNSKMEEAGDYYVCNYIASGIPLDQAIAVSVAVVGSDLSAAWEGGDAAEPPAGQQRTILDATRTAMLNASQPRARLSYEMVYAPATTR